MDPQVSCKSLKHLRNRRGARGPCYAGLGLALAICAGAGLLVMRHHLDSATAAWTQDLVAEYPTYLYFLVTMAVNLSGFGYLCGRREETLQARCITDPLTGLVNRRYFTARLECEVRRCMRADTPLALLLVDVDHLKTINDSEGHGAGDAALRTVATCMHQECRSTDVLARLGGDEFAILAPSTTARQAVELANRLRMRLKGRQCLGRGPTVSIGVSDVGQVGPDEPTRLLEAADRALYTAKEKGRDQVFINNTVRAPSWSPTAPNSGPQHGVGA